MKILHFGSIFLYFLLSIKDPTETQSEELLVTTSRSRKSYSASLLWRPHVMPTCMSIFLFCPVKVISRQRPATVALPQWKEAMESRRRSLVMHWTFIDAIFVIDYLWHYFYHTCDFMLWFSIINIISGKVIYICWKY